MTSRILCGWVLALAPIAASAQPDPTLPAKRIDGYRGIWFTLGQFYGPGADDASYSKASSSPVFPYGDKYAGGLATYTAKHRPLAVYAEEVDKTFFVYGGTTGPGERHLLCMASYYDHLKHRVPRPTVVHDKAGVNDPHDNPSMTIDDEGFVWVFISGRARGRPGYKYRSVKPYSIDRFVRIAEEEMTYPQPFRVPHQGMLHLFTKYTGVRELYFERSLDGDSWSEDRRLAGIRAAGDARGGHYQVSARRGNRIGTFFNRHPKGNVDQRTDLYYIETSDMGTNWATVEGERLQVPLVDVTSPARVHDYASERLLVYLKDMGFDRAGNPVLLYLTSHGHQPGAPNGPRQFRITRWTGNNWVTSQLCQTDHNYDMGSLAMNGLGWQAWLPSHPGPQPHHGGGELVIWSSKDLGESWSQQRQVTRRSTRNHNYVRRPIEARDPFSAFWADGDPTQPGISHLYFSESTGKRVWRLPYVMKHELAEPELYRSAPE